MPSDHMKSITFLLRINILPEKALQSIFSCPTVGSKNEAILDTLIFLCAKEGNFLLLCDVLQALSEETAMKEAVEAFRNGTNSGQSTLQNIAHKTILFFQTSKSSIDLFA